MGISWHEARALIGLYKANGPFCRTATLGRQCLHFDVSSVRRMFKDLGAVPQGSVDEFVAQSPIFAEDFLRLLGATEVVSFDYSSYEGATICHDMNLPLPEMYHNAFDIVYDGGSLEHIFDFPRAVGNCMNMPRESGLFITATPANNFMGHGFYQFSPELFFRLFSEENGFRLERMIAFDYREGGPWFDVQDPAKLGKRVELWGTGQRIVLWVIARKIKTIGGVRSLRLQQSDYTALWAGPSAPPAVSSYPGVYRRLRRFASTALRDFYPPLIDSYRRLRALIRWRREVRERNLRFNKEAFKRVPY